jgi:hypothetical protein
MSGPWEQYQHMEDGPWAEYAQKEIQPSVEQPKQDIGYLESLLRGGAQGATFGFADEIAGASDAIPTALNVLTGSGKFDDVVKSYKAGRDISRDAFKAAEEANPKTFMGGQIAGGILPAIAAAPEAIGAKALAQSGAAIGAITGAGTSEADLTEGEVTPFVKDVGTNAAVGALLNVLGGKVAEKFGAKGLEKTATERAVKATGVNKSQMKNLLKTITEEVSDDKIVKTTRLQQHGKNLLAKSDFLDSPVVTMGATAEDVLERSQKLLEKSGEEIGNILNKLDSQYSIDNPKIREHFFNPVKAIDKIKAIQDQFVKNGEVVPLYEAEFNKLQKAIDTIAKYGNNPINFSEANVLKSLISKTAYNNEGSLTDELMGSVRAIINDQIEEAADTVAQKVGNPQILEQYLTAKDFYRTAKDAINASTGKVAGNLVNRDLGITDYMAGIGAAAAHGSPTGLVTAGAHKLAKTYGNAVIASGANKLSAFSKTLTGAPKEALKSTGEALIQSGDQISTRLGRILIEASNRDDIGRNAVVFSLMQNPDYRKALESLLPEIEKAK